MYKHKSPLFEMQRGYIMQCSRYNKLLARALKLHPSYKLCIYDVHYIVRRAQRYCPRDNPCGILLKPIALLV